jgi:hypothetical protein
VRHQDLKRRNQNALGLFLAHRPAGLFQPQLQ